MMGNRSTCTVANSENVSTVHSSPQSSHTRFDSVRVVVHSTPKHMARMIGVAETWGGSAQTAYVLPKVCEDQDPIMMSKAREFLAKYSYLQMDVRLLPGIPLCYEYPPINVWLHSLLMFKDEVFKWLLKCDDDVYLNVRHLRKFLKKVENAECQNAPCYLGALGTGRPLEKHFLGLNGRPFVMGGPCVVISRAAYDKVLPILPTCMLEFVKRAHSDTMLGRCFQKAKVNVGLLQHSRRKLNRLFKQYYSREGPPSGEVNLPFSTTTVPRVLSPVDHKRVSLHTVKTREEMHNIHAQLHWDAKPLFAKHRNKLPRCTHNEAVANSGIGILGRYPLGVDIHGVAGQSTRDELVRCEKYTMPSAEIKVDMVYIISLNTTNTHVQTLQAYLVPLFTRVSVWPAVDGKKKRYNSSHLSAGENGVKESYASLFQDALSKDLRNILVFEEDALLKADFSHWWQRALLSDCIVHFHAQKSVPSVVLLGTTIHSKHIWEAVEKQVNKEQLLGITGKVRCFDTPPWAYGAFAVLYDSRILSSILNWLEEYDEPFDWVWNFLAVQGFRVSSLAPFLVIAELDKPSSIKDRTTVSVRRRLRRHRWKTDAYMKYMH